jgi:RHS repeat-associated protein
VTIYDTGGNAYSPSTVRQVTVVTDPNSIVGSVAAASSSGGIQMVPSGGALTATGWAVEPNYAPCATVTRIELWLGGKFIGTAQTGIPIQDVANLYNNQNCLNSGWSFSGSTAGVDPGSYILTVRGYDHSGGSMLLQNTPVIFVSGVMPPSSVTNPSPTQYAYSLGYDPKGNVTYSADSVNGNWAYLYDELDRLIAAGSAFQNNLEWTYDSFGNMLGQTVTGGTGVGIQQSFNTNTNRTDQGCYDASGNVLETWSCSQSAHMYAYDAEGRMSSSDWGSTQYVYDAEGRRVAKYSTYLGNQPTAFYFYDNQGLSVAQLDGTGSSVRREIYAGSRHLATYDDQQHTTVYAISDWLGTERARSGVTGVLCQTITSQPFGDAQQVSGNCSPSNNFFTGKERDNESGLDYFGARYFASSMGRWMSPDWSKTPQGVPYATLSNPQSLNLYSYVLNNPIGNRDPDGHICILGVGNTCNPGPPPPPAAPKPPTPAQHVAGAIPQQGGPTVSAASAVSTPRPTSPASFTAGGGLGGNVEVGIGVAGAGANGSINQAISVNSNGQVSAGVVGNNGAVAYVGNSSIGDPNQSGTPLIVGAYGGGGINGFISNASIPDLSGPFQTTSVNIGIGEVSGSVQISTDTAGHWVLSGTVGPGGGFSAWNMTTTTEVQCQIGCHP